MPKLVSFNINTTGPIRLGSQLKTKVTIEYEASDIVVNQTKLKFSYETNPGTDVVIKKATPDKTLTDYSTTLTLDVEFKQINENIFELTITAEISGNDKLDDSIWII